MFYKKVLRSSGVEVAEVGVVVDMNKLDNRKRRTSVLFWGIMNQLQGVGIALASQSKEGFVVAKNVKAA